MDEKRQIYNQVSEEKLIQKFREEFNKAFQN